MTTDSTDLVDFSDLVDLAAERLGGAVLAANDEFFAPKESLLKAGEAVWIEGRYTDAGKWMDGWETRRRREPGFDWCLIRLGLPGAVRGVVVDTSFFRGNYPEFCSLEACALPGQPSAAELADAAWTEILPRSPLEGHAKNPFTLPGDTGRVTHLRFNIFPDGGVARLRVHGEARPDWPRLLRPGGEIDLAAVENGGVVVSCSDMFYGNRHNLNLPGPSLGMHDGWETKRRRGPGHDWAVVRLAARGNLRRVEVDTSWFKGNAPGSCSLEASDGGEVWREILPGARLLPHTRHPFDLPAPSGPVTHVRLNVFPDGGVARLRLWGTVPFSESELLACCGSRAWARLLAESRPFRDLAEMRAASDRIWWSLGEDDWREAFAAHPRIGERGSRWSNEEQAGARGAEAETLSALVEANRRYEERFGHLFIVCATGKSAEEMLEILRSRLGNEPAAELRVAAEEQRQITHLRLQKLEAS